MTRFQRITLALWGSSSIVTFFGCVVTLSPTWGIVCLCCCGSVPLGLAGRWAWTGRDPMDWASEETP